MATAKTTGQTTDPTADTAGIVEYPAPPAYAPLPAPDAIAYPENPFIGPVGLSDLLASATEDREPRVDIPAPIAAYLAEQVKVFAARTNRFKRTLKITDAGLAAAILANRPTARKLTGDAQCTEAAKHFARMVRQYAADNKLSTVPVTSGFSVTFRFAPVRPPKPATAPVTVTSVTTAAK